MFIYAHNELVTSKFSVIAEIYQEFREDDYFLYLGYYEENLYADKARESWCIYLLCDVCNKGNVHFVCV